MSAACPDCGVQPSLVACHDCGLVVSVLECEHTRAADAAYIAAVHAYNATPEETRLSGRMAVDEAAESQGAATQVSPSAGSTVAKPTVASARHAPSTSPETSCAKRRSLPSTKPWGNYAEIPMRFERHCVTSCLTTRN